MQTNAQKKEIIRLKMAELEKLTAEAENDARATKGAGSYGDSTNPQPKVYDGEQVLGIIWSENVTNILSEIQLPVLKAERLKQMRDYLLYHLDLAELIPSANPQQQQAGYPQSQQPVARRYPVQEPSEESIETEQETEYENEIDTVVDNLVEPEPVKRADQDLDMISKKMKAIDSPDGLLNKEEEKPKEASGFKRFLPTFGKKKPIDRDVSDDHQPISMG